MATDNVATEDRGAIVISVSNREGLLYRSNSAADFKNYLCEDIRFGQPYYVGSIRVLLQDTENWAYRFYVQTSLDDISWTMAVDMRNKDFNSSSETLLKFTHRLVLFVRIVNTKCSFKDDHGISQNVGCVRFECPANPAVVSKTKPRASII